MVRLVCFLSKIMRPDHFRLAYEMDPKSISNRLICGSGWFAGSQYACTTGWGTIETDTTYFRVKARTGVWESGWSETVTYKKVVEYPGHGQQEGTAALPTEFGISQNYPNPFNAETRMDIQMPEGGSVDIQIFSITGRRIRNLVQEVKPSGRHSVVWDGKEENGDPVSSGIFIALASIRSETGVVFQKRIKMMVLK